MNQEHFRYWFKTLLGVKDRLGYGERVKEQSKF